MIHRHSFGSFRRQKLRLPHSRILEASLSLNGTDDQVTVLLVSIASRTLHLILDHGADLGFGGPVVIGGLAIELDHDVGRWHGHDIMEMMDIVAFEMFLEIGLQHAGPEAERSLDLRRN